MEISIEAYALTNFVWNTLLLAVIARSRGSVRWKRILFCAFFGTLYAMAMQTGWFPQLNLLVFKLGLAFVLSLAAFPADSLRDLITGTALLLGGTVFAGGTCEIIIRLLGRSALTLYGGGCLGVIALAAALETRGKRLERLEAQMRVTHNGIAVQFTAMVDTGNRLHEPISALPVLIVEEKLIGKLVPHDIRSLTAQRNLPKGFRMVSYGVLGGTGEMPCFRPDEMLVSYGNGWMRAPDMWVGVYPGKMPGTRALAPVVIGRIDVNPRKENKSVEERGCVP